MKKQPPITEKSFKSGDLTYYFYYDDDGDGSSEIRIIPIECKEYFKKRSTFKDAVARITPHPLFIFSSSHENQDELLVKVLRNLKSSPGSNELIDELKSASTTANNVMKLLCSLVTSIDMAFELSKASPDPSYTKYAFYKKDGGRSAVISGFIKEGRIFAGLAYLRDKIAEFPFGLSIHPGLDKTKLFWRSETKIIVHCNHASIYNKSDLNWLFQSAFLLLSNIDASKPIAYLSTNIYDSNLLRIETEFLVTAVGALIKYQHNDALNFFTQKLKDFEPNHPLVREAENTIRRAALMNDIREKYTINGESINDLSGIDFELFLENIFIDKGFNVLRTKASGDFGADLIVETASGTRAAVQAKRFKNKVNLKAVQEVVASVSHYGADFGIVIASSSFFPSAIELAKTNNVELWGEDKLLAFISGKHDFSLLFDA